jgi:hypothetical protein
MPPGEREEDFLREWAFAPCIVQEAGKLLFRLDEPSVIEIKHMN